MVYFVVMNYIVVLLYGILISFSIAGIRFNKKNKFIVLTVYLFLLSIETVLYFLVDMQFIVKLYPLITHLPLILFIYLYYKKPLSQSFFAVTFGYMFCTPRKWIGSLVVIIFNNSTNAGYFAQIIVSIPIFLLINKYISPQIQTYISNGKERIRSLFLIPFIYYFIDYSTATYTNIFYRSTFFTNALIPTLLIIFYVIYTIVISNQSTYNINLLYEKEMLELITTQAKNSLENMKEHEKQFAIQRHDLKHHLQYIASCINEDKKGVALTYISNISTNINKSTITRYCMDENINLIISSYISKILSSHINCKTSIVINNSLPISDMDFCCLFGNSIENAINACNMINDPNKKSITISILDRNEKLCIEIINTYCGNITIKNDIPIRNTSDRGYGTKSIVNIVNKYNGLYTFEVNSETFTLRIVM